MNNHRQSLRKRPIIPQVVCIGMLVWALNPDNPYGYYILLRIVLSASCAYLVLRAADLDKTPWLWILGVTAVVYNPIIPVHLTREIWSVVNVATIVLLFVTFWTLRNPSKQKGEGAK
jgi:uncharacterized membrane protein YhaH (DUF805 family)